MSVGDHPDKSGLVFLHLSDIHFHHRFSGDRYDLDKDLRNELEFDAVRTSRSLSQVDGILVTGDIAFSGKQKEYDAADKWLTHLCDKLKCPHENIWLVPGNHDVDRAIIEQSSLLQDVHAGLRNRSRDELDPKIRSYMNDATAGELIYKPLQQYNSFADRYDCSISASQPYWEHDLTLNDGSTLRLRGLNSTLVSGPTDNEKTARLILGAAQTTLLRHEGVEYLTLCHHPPSWLLDGDLADDMLCARARIQLYGHKHERGIKRIDNSLRITAGATHPERNERGWLPQYSFIAITVKKENQERMLAVDIYCRRWDEIKKEFSAERNDAGGEAHPFVLKLGPWSPAALSVSDGSATLQTHSATLLPTATPPPQGNAMAPARRLAYLYLRLPYQIRLLIAQKLGLVRDEDESVKGHELFQRYFTRAVESGKLESLWDETSRHNKLDPEPNPFLDR